MSDKLEPSSDAHSRVAEFANKGPCTWRYEDGSTDFNALRRDLRDILAALPTPANGEQAERVVEQMGEALPTTTADTRERVKVLEEALEAAAKVLAHHGIAPAVFRQVEAALGNQEERL